MNTAPPPPRPIVIAPATNGAAKADDAATPSMQFTCVTCTRRKVKCDKTGPPCSTCRRTRLQCHYEAPPPRKRKRRPVDDVHERLEHYEILLKQHGILDPSEVTPPSDGTPLSGAPTARVPPNTSVPGGIVDRPPVGTGSSKTGRLLSGHGKSRYIDSTLWRNLNDEEVMPSSDEDEADEQGTPGVPRRKTAPIDPLSASLFAAGSPGQSLLDIHPTYDMAIKLWQVYLTHVEPLTKFLHVPTATATVKRAASNPSSASRSTECLLLAVYHFAVVAMSDEECMQLLGQDRQTLQSRYHIALVQALVNASFLRTTDLMVFRAYTMFLLSVRNHYDPHTFWILTGVGVRIAQRLGLHRDPVDLGLKPYDVELRRRVFWQLLPLDGMASQLSGTGIAFAYHDWDTKPPANVNDEDLDPDMTEPPTPRIGATDMLFCLMRSEMGRFHQKIMPVMGNYTRLWQTGDTDAIDDMEKAIQGLETTFETKYLRFCDPIDSLHLLALLLGRGAPQNARLRVRLPKVKVKGDVDIAELRELWKMATRMFEYDIIAHTNPELKKYAWHLQAVFQWDCLIWVLNELKRGSPAITNPLDAWQKIDRMFSCHPEFMTEARLLHTAMRKLTLRAWDGQPADFCPKPDGDLPFIQKIRTSLERRHSKTSSSTPAIPTSNPWAPERDLAGDSRAFADLPLASEAGAAFGTGMIDDFSPDSIDWMFWDSLIKDSGSYQPGAEFQPGQ